MFEYKAMTNGSLSNPYRFVRKGTKVQSETEISASWLEPIIDGKEPVIQEKPVTPYLDEVTNRAKPPEPVAAIPEAYSDQMEQVIANEKRIDGTTTAEEEAGEAEVSPASDGGEPEATGSGNQDVI